MVHSDYAYKLLAAVMTAAEACERYGLEQSTVRQAIRRGELSARKSGKTWLILAEEAEARWGHRRTLD